MNKKYTSSNLNPKILEDRDDINFGTSFIDVIMYQNTFNDLTSFLDTGSLINFQLSSKVFKIRRWKKYFKKVIFQRLLQPLDHKLISQFIIDQKCQQFMYWDSVIDFKRLNLQYAHQYKYYSCQQSNEAANIQKDIDRTFSQHQYFKQIHNRQRLQRILIALSKIYEELGYIQGLNQIAGCFLISGLSEQQAFWIMYYILKKMKYATIFLDQFSQLKFLNFVVAVFLRNYVPNLSAQFVNINQQLSYQIKLISGLQQRDGFLQSSVMICLKNQYKFIIYIVIISLEFVFVERHQDFNQNININLQISTVDVLIDSNFVNYLIEILNYVKNNTPFSVSDFENIEDLYEMLKDDLFDLLDSNEQYQIKLIEYFKGFKITNRLINELRSKFETNDESLTLSFDYTQKKHYWKKGGDSARSLISSFNEIISEIQEERDTFYQKSQSFLNVCFPRLINVNYLVASEGKKSLSIKIEKRPQLIKRQILSQQFQMSIPQSANGDQESNIYADEIQSKMSPNDDDDDIIERSTAQDYKRTLNKHN